jgi:hypothetical protein
MVLFLPCLPLEYVTTTWTGNVTVAFVLALLIV